MDISGSFKSFASASIGGHFTVTTIRADNNYSFFPEEFSISTGFAVTAMAGGSRNVTTNVDRDESSGSVGSGTDTKDFVKMKDTQQSAGRVGLSFWMAYSTADDDASSSDASEPPAEPSPSPVQPNADDAPKVGQQSAEEMLAENKSGIQFSFQTESSSGSSRDHKIESKARSDENSTATLNHTDVRSSENSTSFGFALGTEENSISIGSKSQSKTTEVASLDDRTTVNVSDESRELYTKINYSNTSETDSSFKFSLGTDDGFEFENESSFYTNISYVEDGGQTSENLTAGYLTENYYVNYSEGFELEDASQPPERASLERMTAYHPNPDFSWVEEYVNNAPPNPFAGDENKTPQQILAEYRAHADQLYRLQALLNTPEAQNDPAQMQYLQDQIAMVTGMMSDLAAEAAAAGITAGQLSDIANAAQAAVAADPPTWTQTQGVGTVAEPWIYWDGDGFDRGFWAGSGEVNYWLATPVRWLNDDVDSYYGSVRSGNWANTDLEGTWTQTITTGTAAIGSASAWAATGLGIYQTLFATGSGELIYGRYMNDCGHFMARVGNGNIYHVLGTRMSGMSSGEIISTPVRWVLAVPLRRPEFVTAAAQVASSEGTNFRNCLTGALRILLWGI